MKIKMKGLELIERGLSSKTVLKLSESEINLLHSKLIQEQPTPRVTTKTVKQIELPSGAETTVGNVSVSNKGGTVKVTPTVEGELEEDDNVDVDSMAPKSSQKPRQIGPGSYMDNPEIDKQMDDDDADGMGMMEAKSKKNPWAICTAKMGKEFGTTERSEWTKKQKEKYESCVMGVKDSLKEDKNNVSLFLEKEIQKIVERNLSPKITKRELMNYIRESNPTTAPKPATPTTRPDTKPRPRPTRPGQNPNPGEKESPMAVEPEKAKKKVISTIMKMLKSK